MHEPQQILLVEDDREISLVASYRLRTAGFDTLTARDGEQGVSAALENHPNAIVMDIRMPRMDGVAALRELQRHDETRDIPVVMLSASLVDQQASLDAGARFFLKKPYDGRVLVTAIKSLIKPESLEN